MNVKVKIDIPGLQKKLYKLQHKNTQSYKVLQSKMTESTQQLNLLKYNY